jgi:rRNA maturation endonuclease Nob1
MRTVSESELEGLNVTKRRPGGGSLDLLEQLAMLPAAIEELRNAKARTVEVPVEVIVEKVIEKIVEVEKIVEKIVEVEVIKEVAKEVPRKAVSINVSTRNANGLIETVRMNGDEYQFTRDDLGLVKSVTGKHSMTIRRNEFGQIIGTQIEEK